MLENLTSLTNEIRHVREGGFLSDISIQDLISVMIFVVEPYIFSFLLLSEQFLQDRP